MSEQGHSGSANATSDIDDSIRVRIITQHDIPGSTKKNLGKTFAKRIDTIVIDVIEETLKNNLQFIAISESIYQEISTLREFLFEKVYWGKKFKKDRQKIQGILGTLFATILKNPKKYINPLLPEDSIEKNVIDFIAGMTDRYALNLFKQLIFPVYVY